MVKTADKIVELEWGKYPFNFFHFCSAFGFHVLGRESSRELQSGWLITDKHGVVGVEKWDILYLSPPLVNPLLRCRYTCLLSGLQVLMLYSRFMNSKIFNIYDLFMEVVGKMENVTFNCSPWCSTKTDQWLKGEIYRNSLCSSRFPVCSNTYLKYCALTIKKKWRRWRILLVCYPASFS